MILFLMANLLKYKGRSVPFKNQAGVYLLGRGRNILMLGGVPTIE
jgi:hypothetical protein